MTVGCSGGDPGITFRPTLAGLNVDAITPDCFRSGVPHLAAPSLSPSRAGRLTRLPASGTNVKTMSFRFVKGDALWVAPERGTHSGMGAPGIRTVARPPDFVRSIIPFPPGGASATTTKATISPTPQIVNIERNPEMNTPRFLETLLMERRVLRKMTVNAFMENNDLSPVERAVLDKMAMQDEALAEYHLCEVASDSLRRNGLTDLTRRRFKDAGMVIDIAEARNKRAHNVIPIRQDIHA